MLSGFSQSLGNMAVFTQILAYHIGDGTGVSRQTMD
jgi:hypothetical protein